MMNALFIVWREFFECVLIVGILYSYLKKQKNASRALRFMWGGVAGGLGLSLVLAYGMQTAENELQGNTLEYFQAGMLTLAAFLMTQMCIWMKIHGRRMKSELQGGLENALSTTRLFGVATLTALALAREGFEAVMFLYGMSIEASETGQMSALIAYSLGGVALTLLTAWAYYRGLKLFNQRLFFRATSVFLLVTASGLLLSAVRKLIQMDAIPTLKDVVWDTSSLLDERSGFGQIVSSLTGYQSTPPLTSVIVYSLFWAVTLYFYFRTDEKNIAIQTQRISS